MTNGYLSKNSISEVHHPRENLSSLTGVLKETKLCLSSLSYRAAKAACPGFALQGKRFPYFYHRYSMTWRSERAVEIPIAWDYVKANQGKRILEIGNVLPHYFRTDHDIVDKYERGPRVLNADALDFPVERRYDFIVSVSTFEHMGFDEETKSPRKPMDVLDRLVRDALAPGGSIVVTFPLGHNPTLDRAVAEEPHLFSEIFFLKRTSKFNAWTQARLEDVRHAKYNEPFPFANALAVGLRRKANGNGTGS